jgi:hypothetical protein
LRLNQRDVIVLEALFTQWSALVRQEMELNTGLVEHQMDLFSNPENTKQMIPQLLWAKIKARRNFFLTTCTREMLEQPPGAHPREATATLNMHTLLFLSGTKMTILGVPTQWTHQEEQPGPNKKAKHNPTGSGTGTPRDDGRYGPTNPFTGERKPAGAGLNRTGPQIFSKSDEVNECLRKFPKLTLRHVTTEAGFPLPQSINTNGLPDDVCLLWIVFGRCTNRTCKRQHITKVSDDAAANLYRQLLPGFTKLRAMSMLPTPPAPRK